MKRKLSEEINLKEEKILNLIRDKDLIKQDYEKEVKLNVELKQSIEDLKETENKMQKNFEKKTIKLKKTISNAYEIVENHENDLTETKNKCSKYKEYFNEEKIKFKHNLKYLRQENIKLIKILKRNNSLMSNSMEELKRENSKLKEDLEKITNELQENIKVVKEENENLRKNIEESERKAKVLEIYKTKAGEYEKESIEYKNEWMKVSEEFTVFKENLKISEQQRREEELRIKKGLNEEKSKLQNNFANFAKRLQENIKILTENNFYLKNKVEESENKIKYLENYRQQADNYVNLYKNESFGYKNESFNYRNELIKVKEEMEALKKNFQLSHQYKEYLRKEDETRIIKELNDENSKLYKELKNSKEKLTNFERVYSEVLVKIKNLETDKEVKEKEIKNLSEIIEREREKLRPFSSSTEETEYLRRKSYEMGNIIKELNEKLVQSEKKFEIENEKFKSYKTRTENRLKNLEKNNIELIRISKQEKEKSRILTNIINGLNEKQALSKNNTKNNSEEVEKIDNNTGNQVKNFELKILELLEIIKQEAQKHKLLVEVNENLKRNNFEFQEFIKELNGKLVQSEKKFQNIEKEFANFKNNIGIEIMNYEKNKIQLLEIIKQEREKIGFYTSYYNKNKSLKRKLTSSGKALELKNQKIMELEQKFQFKFEELRKCDNELKNKILEFENYKLTAVKSMDYYQKESINFKNEWIKVSFDSREKEEKIFELDHRFQDKCKELINCENKFHSEMKKMTENEKFLNNCINEEREKYKILFESNEVLKKKCDEMEKKFVFQENRIQDLINYKMPSERSLDYYQKESLNFKNQWLKISCDLNKELDRSRSLEKQKDFLEQESKKLAQELNELKLKMTETEESLRKEIEELNEKLEEFDRNTGSYDKNLADIKIKVEENLDNIPEDSKEFMNHCVKIELDLDEELRQSKSFQQQNNHSEQENKRLTEELRELKNRNTRMSETLEVLQNAIQKISEELRQEKLKNRTLEIQSEILKEEKNKLSDELKLREELKKNESNNQPKKLWNYWNRNKKAKNVGSVKLKKTFFIQDLL